MKKLLNIKTYVIAMIILAIIWGIPPYFTNNRELMMVLKGVQIAWLILLIPVAYYIVLWFVSLPKWFKNKFKH